MVQSAGQEAAVRPFCAWNECWMKRPDLQPGYDGWQAVDAAPQGTGSGQRCHGPAPVKAIKEGRLDVPFDVATFFAATNATCATWVHLENGELKQAFPSSRHYIGNNISTKGVGSERCEDITHCYKYPEEHILSTALPYVAAYGPALKSTLLLKVTALVRDKHPLSTSSATFLAWQEIHFRAPGLTIQVPESVIQFRPTEAKIQLHNPLPESLPDSVVSVSGQGLVHKERCYRLGPTEAGTARWLRIPFTPTQAGARRLTVHVESSGLIQPCRSLRTVRVIPAGLQSSTLSQEAA
ncbi:hypothetical protein JRQ81_014498 [Phrynocephalus forsythii]|uniref:Transglutaminase C-terminal domain-containing protein n=1 Tax=Phrynocephalus forsythii TaxID=171643 RepID=A0A9Q0XZG6_9SAUR|nr:hypothetical protein JRQ81_014498 [Phrynocephalus forsythii]